MHRRSRNKFKVQLSEMKKEQLNDAKHNVKLFTISLTLTDI